MKNEVMDDLRHEVHQVFETIREGLAAVHRRFDDARERANEREQLHQQRHGENIARFQRQDDRLETIEADIKAVEVEVRETNSTLGQHENWLTRHDEQIRSLFAKVKDAALKTFGVSAGPHTRESDADLEKRRITVKDARVFAGLIGFGGAAAWFVLRVLLGWGPR